MNVFLIYIFIMRKLVLNFKLKDDLDRTTGQLQEEKMRRSLRESARSLRPSDLDDDLPRGKSNEARIISY